MLNEERITNRMLNLIESGFFGKNKFLLTEQFTSSEKIRLFQAVYNYSYKQNILVDGIRGKQTNNAIADVKNQLLKDENLKFNNTNAETFFLNFLDVLKTENIINVGRGGSNDKMVNYAIQSLITLAGQPIKIDGVVGTQTITAIKALTNSETITKDNIQPIIDKAKANIKELGIEDASSMQNTSIAQNKAPEEKGSSKEVKKSETSNTNKNESGKADVIFVAGLESLMSAQGQTEKLRAGLPEGTNIKTFTYNSLGAIKEFLKSNPRIPIYLFSAGAGNAAALVSDPNVDKSKLFVIEPYTHEPVPPNSNNFVPTGILNVLQTANIWSQVYVGKYPTVGSLLLKQYAVQPSNGADHFDAVTQVARKTS
jgi:lysozyme family protein